jgi:hypothetical protein
MSKKKRKMLPFFNVFIGQTLGLREFEIPYPHTGPIRSRRLQASQLVPGLPDGQQLLRINTLKYW